MIFRALPILAILCVACFATTAHALNDAALKRAVDRPVEKPVDSNEHALDKSIPFNNLGNRDETITNQPSYQTPRQNRSPLVIPHTGVVGENDDPAQPLKLETPRRSWNPDR